MVQQTSWEPRTGGPVARRGEVTLDYELTGPADAPVLLLAAGLGMQRIEWPPELLEALHHRGMRTLCVDNRDCGHSTIVGSDTIDADFNPLAEEASYGLADIALDLVAVLDALGLDRVHAAGMSMGGMIVQHLALSRPDRLLTCTSLMSTTGARGVGGPHQQAKWTFRAVEPSASEEDFVAHAVRKHRSIGSPAHLDPDRAAAVARQVFARGVHPRGTARQFAAIREDGDRTERLAALTVPLLVIHGTADPMIDVSGGEATAQAVPGAQLELLDGMGHDIPPAYAPRIAELLVGHALASGGQAPA